MKQRAFTLIELMIVVAIIGILAAIAIPNFLKFQCRAKQSEVKTVMKNILVAEDAYRAEHDEYVQGTEAQLAVISFAVSGTVRRYLFEVIGATATTFTAEGRADGTRADALIDANGVADQWVGTETGSMVSLHDACN